MTIILHLYPFMCYWNIVVTIWKSCYSWQCDVIRAKKREKELQICNLLFSKYELNIIPICQNNPKNRKMHQSEPPKTVNITQFYEAYSAAFTGSTQYIAIKENRITACCFRKITKGYTNVTYPKPVHFLPNFKMMKYC